MNRICVFCGSSYGKKSIYTNNIQDLADAILKAGLELVYGGSNIGLMGVLARRILENKGKVIGIIPRYIFERVEQLKGIELYIVKTMHERKAKMYEFSDGFIVFPGGIGTLEEFFEVYTWQGLGYHSKPVGIMNVNGYYNTLIELLDQALSEGFLKESHRVNLLVETEAEKLIKKMKNFKPVSIRFDLKKI
jgi:uncharacterized protein (TIGR00730 family)